MEDNPWYRHHSIPVDYNQAVHWRLGNLSYSQNRHWTFSTFSTSHHKPWLYQVPLSWYDRYRLRLRSGFNISPVDIGYRRSYPILPPSDIRSSFRHIHPQMASSLPLIYLEGYSDMTGQLRTSHYPPVIASGPAYTSSEFFKFYAAAASEHGSKLVSIQHGAGYGMYLDAPSEWHEQQISDRFLSWGWNAHSISLPPKRPSNRHSGILFMATGYEPHIHRFYSRPASLSQWNQYYLWQQQFIQTLNMRDEFTYRHYPRAYRHGSEYDLMKKFPDIKCDYSRRSLLSRYKLIVTDHPGTPLLESLRYGIPTICFWNPLYNELRPEAIQWFKELESRHILWHSPVEAADFINRSWSDLELWWNHPYTESIRRGFVQHFARTSDNWMDSWITQIN